MTATPRDAARMMRVFTEIDVFDLLPKVDCSVLRLHANGDARVPFDQSRLIAGGSSVIDRA